MSVEIACPHCGGTKGIIKGKPEYGGGLVHWKKNGGCGWSWDPYAPAVGVPEDAPHPASAASALREGESLDQAVTRVMETKPEVKTAVVIPSSANEPAIKNGILPLGTVEVVTTMGTFTFPPRSTYHLEQGWLRIKRPDGAETDVFNAVIVNRVRFHLS